MYQSKLVQVAVASTVVLATGLTAVYLDRSQTKAQREAKLARMELLVVKAQEALGKLQEGGCKPGDGLAALSQVEEELAAVAQRLASTVAKLAKDASRVEDSGWLGTDTPGSKLRRASLRRRAEVLIGEGVRPLQQTYGVLRAIAEIDAAVAAHGAATRALERDAAALPAVASAEVAEQTGGAPAQARVQQEAVAEEDCAKHATTLGYYHFDSSGRKFKNKWDDFDVDAECQRVDQEEALEAVLKRALGLGAKLERLLTNKVDTLRSADTATVAKRKQLAAHINDVLLVRVDKVKMRVAAALKTVAA